MSQDENRDRVTMAVWRWTDPPAQSPSMDSRNRRRHALLDACLMGGVGAVLRFGFGHVVLAWVVWGLASLVLLGGLAMPGLYNGFQAAGRWLARTVGSALTWALLAPFFYLCFAFGRAVLLVLGRDPMHRRFMDETPTYWEAMKPVSSAHHYTSQYDVRGS